MRRPAALRLQRSLAALLWLLASFAYLTRDQSMADMPGMISGPGMAMETAAFPAAEQATPQPAAAEQAQAMADMPEMARAAPETDQVHQPKTAAASHDANAPPALPVPDHQRSHAGHCPFCFTAAFALEAGPVRLPVLGAATSGPAPVPTLHLPRPLPPRFRARAPPC